MFYTQEPCIRATNEDCRHYTVIVVHTCYNGHHAEKYIIVIFNLYSLHLEFKYMLFVNLLSEKNCIHISIVYIKILCTLQNLPCLQNLPISLESELALSMENQ